ncbi:hypothetical protein [Meridianimarinicoccus roseus]|nr:hypothetical protein [Meridianimarinicoccus roseus]
MTSAFPLISLLLVTCIGLMSVGLFQSASDLGRGPLVVVAPPWHGGPAAIVAAAGGRIVGLDQAPLSVLADGASAEALREAGAWFVLGSSALNFFCGTGADT